MDNIKYYITKIMEHISYPSNSQNLKISICTEINNISNILNEVNNKILKTNEHKQFLEKTINDNEDLYKLSKAELDKFDNILKQKVNEFILDMNNKNEKLDNNNEKLDNNNEKLDNNNIKSLNKIKLISDKYNNLILDSNDNIFTKYNKLTKNIEDNILKCEISKEKIEPVLTLLESLLNEKNKLEIKMNNLNEVKKNLSTTE